MALTPFIRASQALVRTVAGAISPAVEVTQAAVRTVINFPTDFIRVAQAQVRTVAKADNNEIRVAQALVRSVVLGRVEDPHVRAWTFTLDGHDYYVLRLGDAGTLVYDVYSQQWVDWTSPDLQFWRPNCGVNWIGGQRFGEEYGSDVLVGDDVYGLLYFLHPEQPYDQAPSETADPQERYFERVTMGQIPMRGREVLPCYAAWLTTDMGDPAYIGAGVTLYTSDDGGRTFDDHGLVTVTPGEYNPELSWYSLGQIEAPGRLFKLVDDGAIVRIDGLEMNDPDDAG